MYRPSHLRIKPVSRCCTPGVKVVDVPRGQLTPSPKHSSSLGTPSSLHFPYELQSDHLDSDELIKSRSVIYFLTDRRSLPKRFKVRERENLLAE
ncbi:hypothetical protein RUM43_004779 [Polyplax serrata]|uniref:Uncharacterized protein n=1 Tax=Polyplax serrata TaxID=468196 RepID=A0AAN8SC57_POLSC